MKLEPGDYVVLNLVIVTIVVASYLFIRRTPRPPAKLNLRGPAGADKNGKTPPSSVIRNFSSTEYKPRSSNPALTGETVVEQVTNPSIRFSDPDPAGIAFGEPLNALFNWNGHTWDAYEILGIPAGSSEIVVDAAFERVRRGVDPESVPFVTAAYKAIKNRV